MRNRVALHAPTLANQKECYLHTKSKTIANQKECYLLKKSKTKMALNSLEVVVMLIRELEAQIPEGGKPHHTNHVEFPTPYSVKKKKIILSNERYNR
jgi:hypothetical protein